jgi:hypothetical protein
MRSSDALAEDLLEALVGTLYLDQGLEFTRSWLVKLFESNVDFARFAKTDEKDMFLKAYKDTFGRTAKIITRKCPNGYEAEVMERQELRLVQAEIQVYVIRPTKEMALQEAALIGLQMLGFQNILALEKRWTIPSTEFSSRSNSPSSSRNGQFEHGSLFF